MRNGSKYVFWFIVSFVGLLGLNVLLISLLSKSTGFAIQQLWDLRLYILPLGTGFSTQVVLFLKIKEAMKNSALLVSGTGAVNTGTMIACCAHHLTEAIPFLAVSGLSSFLINYQKELLLISIAINWFGVLYLFKKLRRLHAS